MSGSALSPRRDVSPAVLHSVALAVACLVSYYAAFHLLKPIHSVPDDDDLLGGMWAVIATVFIYRTGYSESTTAAAVRVSATLVSFALCLAYLLIFPFHPLGLAVVIGVGTLVLTLAGRPEDVVTCAITTAVVLVVAGISPTNAWHQPILRLVDTAVGTLVALTAVAVARRLEQRADPARSTGRADDDRLTVPETAVIDVGINRSGGD
jgi:uncharacterized membrane protein YccC